jgi:hypothetical protein
MIGVSAYEESRMRFRGLLWSLAFLGVVFIGGALVTGTVALAATIVATLIVVGIVGADHSHRRVDCGRQTREIFRKWPSGACSPSIQPIGI